jgi:uncharacterized protein with GYD domain
MLHMLVSTHNPESCAFRGEAEHELLTGGFDTFKEKATERGCEVRGWWVNPPSHEIFVLVEAPGAHVIDEALIEAGLVGRTHSKVLAVVPLEELP